MAWTRAIGKCLCVLGILAPALVSGAPALADGEPAVLPGAATATTAPACGRALLLRNTTDAAVTIDVAGSGLRRLKAHEIARHCSSVADVAWTVQTRAWTWRGAATLLPGERRTVDITQPGTTLQIRNLSGEVQLIRVGGAAVGRLSPNQTMTVGPVPPGDQTVLAESVRSAMVWSTTVQAVAGATVKVTLPRPHGVVRTRNPLEEQATLTVLGHAYGAAEPQGRLLLVGLAPGAHPLRWTGLTSGRVVEQTAVADDIDDQRSPKVAISVENRTGEDLQLPEGLRDVATVLKARSSDTWLLPRGQYGVTLTGVDSGLPYKFDVFKSGSPWLQWKIGRPTATLRLINRSGERAVVDVPILGPLSLGPTDKAVLRVPAGRMVLQARQPDRDKPLKTGLFLQPGREYTWDLRARSTHTVVHSAWREPVELRVDGRVAGLLRPGKDLRIPMTAGRHQIVAVVARLRWRESVDLDIRDGDQLETTFAPPTGALRLGNAKGSQSLEIWRDGERLATAPAGSEAAVAQSAGRVEVAVKEVKSGREALQSAIVAPTQQVGLAPPSRLRVGLTLVSHAGRPIAVQMDDGAERTLQDGEAWSVGEVAAVPHLLQISDGAQRLRTRLELDGTRSQVRVELWPAKREQTP